MIYLKLKGGLGNQLFQYAFGYALSIRLSKNLILDTTYYSQITLDTKRNFDLDQLNISYFSKVNYVSFINRLRNRLNSIYFNEESFDFNLINNYTGKQNIVIDGYWQSEEYFRDSKLDIINKFSPLRQSSTFLFYKNKILSENCASIHIRRGDYISNPKAALVHSVCGLDYYMQAVEIVNKKTNSPVIFYIFTDDKEWALANFKTNNFRVICAPELSHIDELFLMSYCKHNVISASSFSWWGAWLNLFNDKIVITPHQWYKKRDTPKNLIPSNWIKI